MRVIEKKIGEIKPYGNNPRKNDEAVERVATSIREFGFQQPLVVDENLIIIVGHTRFKAALKLGLKKVPVHIAANLSPEQAKAYRLMDNKSNETATWDDELLKKEFEELEKLDFDLNLTGFDANEIMALQGAVAGLTDENATPEIQKKEISKPGDIWILGNHRLICGSSIVKSDVEKVLAGVQPNLMVTDPPYGVEYDANWRNKACRTDGSAIGGRATGKVLNDDKADWGEAWSLFPGDVAYVWHAGLHAVAVAKSLTDTGFILRAQIIWAKSRFVIGRGDYHYQHEPCWYAVKKGKPGRSTSDRTQSTLWQINHTKSDTGHSTQKPVECMRKPIENNSSVGQVVYDPFCGSGTTIIAAEQTGRHCYAVELNPAYIDMAVRRWQNFTGGKAILEATGKPFPADKK